VSLDGPLEFVYRRSVRKSVGRGLPDGVERLAILAASEGLDHSIVRLPTSKRQAMTSCGMI